MDDVGTTFVRIEVDARFANAFAFGSKFWIAILFSGGSALNAGRLAASVRSFAGTGVCIGVGNALALDDSDKTKHVAL